MKKIKILKSQKPFGDGAGHKKSLTLHPEGEFTDQIKTSYRETGK
jgi:hypothetical protein